MITIPSLLADAMTLEAHIKTAQHEAPTPELSRILAEALAFAGRLRGVLGDPRLPDR